MKTHLFCRFTDCEDAESVTLDDRHLIRFENNRVYLHKVLRINYTTYDSRRCQDSINPRTHSDVLVSSTDENDTYLFACVIGIFHAKVSFNGGDSNQVDFLWVRWYAREYDVSCWKTK